MAVTVITYENQHLPSIGDVYEDANHFFEKDGSLHVVAGRSDQSAVAIYKTGTWLYAFVGEQIARKRGSKTFVEGE